MGTKTVYASTAEGNSLATLGPQLAGGIELRAPSDVAVDGTGRLYIVDSRLGALIVVECPCTELS